VCSWLTDSVNVHKWISAKIQEESDLGWSSYTRYFRDKLRSDRAKTVNSEKTLCLSTQFVNRLMKWPLSVQCERGSGHSVWGVTGGSEHSGCCLEREWPLSVRYDRGSGHSGCCVRGVVATQDAVWRGSGHSGCSVRGGVAKDLQIQLTSTNE